MKTGNPWQATKISWLLLALIPLPGCSNSHDYSIPADANVVMEIKWQDLLKARPLGDETIKDFVPFLMAFTGTSLDFWKTNLGFDPLENVQRLTLVGCLGKQKAALILSGKFKPDAFNEKVPRLGRHYGIDLKPTTLAGRKVLVAKAQGNQPECYFCALDSKIIVSPSKELAEFFLLGTKVSQKTPMQAMLQKVDRSQTAWFAAITNKKDFPLDVAGQLPVNCDAAYGGITFKKGIKVVVCLQGLPQAQREKIEGDMEESFAKLRTFLGLLMAQGIAEPKMRETALKMAQDLKIECFHEKPNSLRITGFFPDPDRY